MLSEEVYYDFYTLTMLIDEYLKTSTTVDNAERQQYLRAAFTQTLLLQVTVVLLLDYAN